MLRLHRVLVPIAVAFLLASCAAPAGETAPASDVTSAPPSPTSQSTVTPSPSAEAQVQIATGIVSADGISFVTADGASVADVVFAAPVEESLATLTDVLGDEPVTTEVPVAPSDGFYGTQWAWDGIALLQRVDGNGDPATVGALVTAAVHDTIVLESAAGVTIGDPIQPLIDADPDDAGFGVVDADGVRHVAGDDGLVREFSAPAGIAGV